jgi:hypothetical protein
MQCPCCKHKFDANKASILLSLPFHVAASYPVESNYAFSSRNSHLSRNTTELFRHLMITYGNGELCSKLLYDTLNRAYIGRIVCYYSYGKSKGLKLGKYEPKDGTFIKMYPPLGDTIRDIFDDASASNQNPWRLSDNDRHTREIQGVKCGEPGAVFAQDHTFEIVRNYPKSLGAKACWDAATSTGEIACAVLVPTTKTIHLSHAAMQLARREGFSPRAMYSDTWPNKKEYWEAVFPNIEGRLGLFHFEKRIISTLRRKHIDYMDALTDLLSALYVYSSEYYEKLLTALKEGTLSPSGKKYSSQEIADLKGTKLFWDRYSKYLRKDIREPQTMIQMLDDWFCKYKVNSSDPSHPGRGRLDPIRGVSLFTSDTKDAVENCKLKAQYLTDPFPFQEMYDEIKPNPKCQHQLTEYLSKREESKLESYHDRAAHFANIGMRASLADSLNLAGTAIHNLKIRHKRSIMPLSEKERRLIPSTWEKVLPDFNHTELCYINNLALSVGCTEAPPHSQMQRFCMKTGERFFSQYFTSRFHLQKWDVLDRCCCISCSPPCLSAEIVETPKTISPSGNLPAKTVAIVATNPPAPPAPPAPPQQQQVPTTPRQPLIQHNRVSPPAGLLIPQTQLLPTIPMYYVAPSFCCDKYQEWCFGRRVGRPPHHPLCLKNKHQIVRRFGYPPML